LVKGDRALHLVLGVLIVKWLIWSVALGSGTSGGVLAPVMMIGAGLGALMSYGLPDAGPGFWALIGIGAMLSGTLRVPMTAIVFTVEQTHDWNLLLPLLLGCVASYAVSAILLRRSILTEKVARRGYHVSSEYAVDPLELLYAREVMRTPEVILQAESTLEEGLHGLTVSLGEKQRLLPVVDKRGALVGVLTRGDLQKSLETRRVAGEAKQLREIVSTAAVVADADEPLRVVVNRMAKKGVTRMPVVERGSGKFLGLISLDDLLKARTRHLEEEHRREQTLWLPYFGPTRAESAKADS
jgi:CBS domain-containing protein